MDKDNKSMNNIKLCVYFHTSGSGVTLEPKVAFMCGYVCMPTNHKHGIRASDSEVVYFGKGQGTLSEAITKCVKNYGVKFISEEKKTEYRKFQEMKTKQDFYEDPKV